MARAKPFTLNSVNRGYAGSRERAVIRFRCSVPQKSLGGRPVGRTSDSEYQLNRVINRSDRCTYLEFR